VRLLGALAFAAVCLFAVVGHPGALRAADPVAPAPTLAAFDGPFTRNQQVELDFVAPPEGGPVALYRASNDAVTADGILSNGASVANDDWWTLAPGADGPRTVYGQVQYESGLWSPVASVSLTLDRTPESSIYVDIDSVGSRIPAPPTFDWHARTATPADRIFGQGNTDGTPDPITVGVGDATRFIYLQGSDQPLAPGSYVVHRRTDFGCENACVVVGAMGHFCEASGGSFTVTDIAFTAEGDLSVLDADFRVECIDTEMSGSIRYGATRDVDALDQDAESLLFPAEHVGDVSAGQSITFTNIGTTATTLGAADLVGIEPADFEITSDACSGATLAVGATCAVEISFAPSAVGQRQAFLEIPDETSRGSRHVLVQGAGVLTTPPTAGTVVIMGGARCTDSRSVQVRATGATDAVAIARLELSNLPDTGYVSRPISPPQTWKLSAGDGRKSVYARWWNRAGQTSPVVKDTILLDTTDPHATRPGASIRAVDGVVDGRVRVRLDWTGSDATCGIARYVVSVSRDGHAWTRSGDATRATHVIRHLAKGTTYRFRVRAIDRAGNVGRWATGPAFRIVGSNAHPRIQLVQP
jgi:hypothetical protein